MTLKAFWENKKKLFIKPDNEEEANKFCKESHRLGRCWCTGDSYIKRSYWSFFGSDICYSNRGTYSAVDIAIKRKFKIIKFKEIDFGKEE